MSNFFIEKRQVTIVKLLKTRWANKLKNLLNQESIIFTVIGLKPNQILLSHDLLTVDEYFSDRTMGLNFLGVDCPPTCQVL